MTLDNPRVVILLSDTLILRRAAYLSLLGPWAIENNFEIQECGEGSASPSECDGRIALEILILGAGRVEDPAVHSQLLQRRRMRPDVPLALVSDHEDRAEVTAAFRHGVRGFVPSSLKSDLARQAFGFILAGGTFFPPRILEHPPGDGAEPGGRKGNHAVSLTPRQLDVLALLREGHSNKLIARDLSMCESTVKVHVRQIMRKLGAANRTQAALNGLVPVSPGRSSRNAESSDSARQRPESAAAPEAVPTRASESPDAEIDERSIAPGPQHVRAR
ncbi:MAG TPA: response regulator transcription factor [Saliniramus sp.]|nr:response regulator transcription factor [Saliniramus sp.]